jgi:IPT/TIG domain-containing protein
MRAVKMLCAAAMLFSMAACSNELKVSNVEPPQGTYAGGEEVVIRGNGFQPGRGGVTVKFGKRDATSVVVAAADKINVMTPGGDPNTTVDVTVIFDDGKAFRVGNGFHYMPPADQRGTLDKAFNNLGNDKTKK